MFSMFVHENRISSNGNTECDLCGIFLFTQSNSIKGVHISIAFTFYNSFHGRTHPYVRCRDFLVWPRFVENYIVYTML